MKWRQKSKNLFQNFLSKPAKPKSRQGNKFVVDQEDKMQSNGLKRALAREGPAWANWPKGKLLTKSWKKPHRGIIQESEAKSAGRVPPGTRHPSQVRRERQTS